MRRITLEEVKAAYEKTGLKPRRGSVRWGVGCLGVERVMACCPLGVMYALQHGTDSAGAGTVASDVYEWAALTYGDDYSLGIQNGFDRHREISRNSDECRAGYEDGKAIAAALFGEAA